MSSIIFASLELSQKLSKESRRTCRIFCMEWMDFGKAGNSLKRVEGPMWEP